MQPVPGPAVRGDVGGPEEGVADGEADEREEQRMRESLRHGTRPAGEEQEPHPQAAPRQVQQTQIRGQRGQRTGGGKEWGEGGWGGDKETSELITLLHKEKERQRDRQTHTHSQFEF